MIKYCVYHLLFSNNFVNIKLYKRFTGLGDAWQSERCCEKKYWILFLLF